MRRRMNKKGLSLVELIAVSVISVIVIGAASIAFFSGSQDAMGGATDYTNHGDAQLLETWLRKNLPTASSIEVKSVQGTGTVSNLFFQTGTFHVQENGKEVMQISGIQQVNLYTENINENQQLEYEIITSSNHRTFRFSGGIVLNNVPENTVPMISKKSGLLPLKVTDPAPKYIVVTPGS